MRITDHSSISDSFRSCRASAPLAICIVGQAKRMPYNFFSPAESGEAAESVEAWVREKLLGLDSAWL